MFEMPRSSLQVFLVCQTDGGVGVGHAPEPAVAASGDEAPVFGIDHVVPSVPAVLFETVVEDILDDEAILPRLSRPVSSEEAAADCTARAVAADDVVGFDTVVAFRLALGSDLDVCPRHVSLLILRDVEHFVVKPHFDEVAILLNDMPIHNLDNLSQRQNRHAVLVVFHNRHVDLDEFLQVRGSSPADCREFRNGCGADVW